MRKNRMMRLASVLLVCVLLTTSVISGTFAKYVTQDSASDTARVAKWGVTVDASGSLFGEHHFDVTDTNSNEISLEVTDSVDSSGEVKNIKNIVAPGTKNTEGFKISVSGTPEVAWKLTADVADNVEDIYLGEGSWGVMVKVTGLIDGVSDVSGLYKADPGAGGLDFEYVAEGKKQANWAYYELQNEVTLDEDYYPINWTITGGTNVVQDQKNLTTLVTNLDFTATGNANDTTVTNRTLTWDWPFEQFDTNGNSYNGADTILGHLMLLEEDNYRKYGFILGELYTAYNPNQGVAPNEDPEATVVYKSGSSDIYQTISHLNTQTLNYNLNIIFDYTVTVEQVD